MIYKKIIIIFLLILCIFSFSSFSSVHAENINVTSSSSERMKSDIDFFKQVLKDNNINNMYDLETFLGATFVDDIEYFFIQDAGHTYYSNHYVYFYKDFSNILTGVNDYNYYGIQQNSFSPRYGYALRYRVFGTEFIKFNFTPTYLKTPVCWFGVKTADLFTKDSSQIVEDLITQDNSSQNDINLKSHNGEMDTASDTIKNSNLYSKFDNLTNEINEALTYNDDEVSTIPISFYGKKYVLRSDEISSFFKNNNLGFVVLLWQSILWFSLFYTMFLFVRKLYKAFAGGNPVDDVSSTLSNEDNKIVGGF